jgi:2-haloacid dehalogenase
MMSGIQAFVFDAYGTLFDVHSVIAAAERAFPGKGQALSQLWRAKQLEYTWLRSLMERYEDFWKITAGALKYACLALGLEASPQVQKYLMEEYLRLELFKDVAPALEALGDRTLAILSNGSPKMLQAVVEYAGLSATFRHVLSVDEVQVYKPAPAVYALAPERLKVPKELIGFVSANPWDACGAKAFGLTVFWLNRSGALLDELGCRPDAIIETLTELVG